MTQPCFEVCALGIDLGSSEEFLRQSFDSMCAAGEYDWVHPDIIDQNFPFTFSEKHSLDLVTVTFSRCVAFDEATSEMTGRGLFLGGIEHLWLVGARQPSLQLEHCVVAPGSVWTHPNGVSYLAHLRSSFQKRQVYIRYTNLSWDTRWRFLALSP